MGLTGGALTTAEEAQAAAQPLGQAAMGLFGLGQRYLAQSPEELRQRYFSQQQALLAQPRAAEEARLASGVFGRGRAGLNIGTTGQPELAALAGARRQQDLALAAQAEQGAQQQLGFGSSLFGTGASLLGQQYAIPTQALAPLSSLLGTVGTVEQLGQQPFNLGLAVGGAAQPGAQAAKKALQHQLKWIMGFEEIILLFDNDDAGIQAAQDCASLFPHDRQVQGVPGARAAGQRQGRADQACAGSQCMG